MKKAISYINVIVTILCILCIIITFLYPEVVKSLKLSPSEARVIIMTLISLILLLSFLQPQLTLSWRLFCLIAAFLIIIESVLMLGTWEKLIK